MRKVMVVSRTGLFERKMKLLSSPFRLAGLGVTLGCTCRYESTFKATGLRVVLILFPGKAMRPPTNPVGQEAVAGLKIWPRRTGVLSQGLVAPVAAPSKAEKSPVRSASVGKVERLEVVGLFRYCSQEKKKNVLSCPLYNLGSHTGPP